MKQSPSLLQKMVLISSLLPPIVTFLSFGLGTSFEKATASPYSRPLIEPAGYAFIIWSLIYLGGVAFGIYQYQPAQRNNEFFRSISPYAVSAFLGTSCWLVMARFNQQWLTVLCIFWIFFSLLFVFLKMTHYQPQNRKETWFVHIPFSIFFGWLSVAIFANTASALKTSGWNFFNANEVFFTLAFLLLSLFFVSYVLRKSMGNLVYSATIIWALIAIAVANLMEGQNKLVALSSAAGALAVLLLLFFFYRKKAEMQ